MPTLRQPHTRPCPAPPSCSPYNDFWAATDFMAIIVFTADMSMKFMLAYHDPEEGMIKDHRRIALNYVK